MFKTVVYRLVNGRIAHQKQPISKKMILLSSTLTRRQCHAASYHLLFRYLLFSMCNVAISKPIEGGFVH